MEINLEKLKKNFQKIKDIRDKVTHVFNILEVHLKKLKTIYSEFVENNRQNLFIFGLDSFQFQSKLLDIEYDDMKRLFLAINNKMYCEYYKLHKIISEYVKESINDKKTIDLIKVSNIFPVYKDLEPYKQYKFELIQDIHENIILLLYGINEFILNKENELQSHIKKQEIGLNINNFVTTFNYNIIMIKEKGLLFISYIDFFHSLHTKYLQRFAMKMNLMYNQVIHDIRFEDSPTNTETKKKELINNFKTDNIDNKLILEIKKSFDDSDSNQSDTPSKVKLNDAPEIQKIYNSDCLNINSLNENNNSNSNLKDVFKNNVKKIINGMRIFNKKKNSEILSSASSDSNLLIDLPTLNLESNNQNSNENNLKLLITEENKIIESSKSAEEIFIEIEQQCEEITDKNSESYDLINMNEIYYNKEIENNDKNIDNDKEHTIINRVLSDLILEIEESNKIDDENLSIVTMDSHGENYLEYTENKTEENKNDNNAELHEFKENNNEEKKDIEENKDVQEVTTTKKKRKYKPRKSKNN